MTLLPVVIAVVFGIGFIYGSYVMHKEYKEYLKFHWIRLKREVIERTKKEFYEKMSCEQCANHGKCAIYDNFNIDFCSDWREENGTEESESRTE